MDVLSYEDGYRQKMKTKSQLLGGFNKVWPPIVTRDATICLDISSAVARFLKHVTRFRGVVSSGYSPWLLLSVRFIAMFRSRRQIPSVRYRYQTAAI